MHNVGQSANMSKCTREKEGGNYKQSEHKKAYGGERSLDQSGQLKKGSRLYQRYLSLAARAQSKHNSLHSVQGLNTYLCRGSACPAIISAILALCASSVCQLL